MVGRGLARARGRPPRPRRPRSDSAQLGNDARGDGVVWAEAAENVRERLDAMLRLPQEDPALEALLSTYPRSLRFRVLVVHDPEQCRSLAQAMASAVGRSAVAGTAR
jgi:hypothetical protein